MPAVPPPIPLTWKQLASFRPHTLETPFSVVKWEDSGYGQNIPHPGTIEILYEGLISDPDLEPCLYGVIFGLLTTNTSMSATIASLML